MNDDFVELVQNARFTTRKRGRAYREPEVDMMLDWIVEALKIGAPLQPVLDRYHLRKAWLRGGYDIKAVDTFLAQLMAEPIEYDPGQAGSLPPPYHS